MAWIINPDTITRTSHPEFTARWLTGEPPEPLPSCGEMCAVSGMGDYDSITLFHIVWRDGIPPDGGHLDVLGEAVTALDGWIGERF